MIISGYETDKTKDDVAEHIDNERDKVTLADAQKDAEREREEREKKIEESYDIHHPKRRVLVHTQDEIRNWDFVEALENDPLYRERGAGRSAKAFKILYNNIRPTNGFLIPGQVCTFLYNNPKTREELEWWDRTPCTLFFGYFKTNKGLIRELGFNLHYYPPYIRKKIMTKIFYMYRSYFLSNFDTHKFRKLSNISYDNVVGQLRAAKLDFGIKEYVPGLR